MLVKPRLPNVSFTTPASLTRSAKCMMALRRWTGWSRSRSAASRSRLLRRLRSGPPKMRPWIRCRTRKRCAQTCRSTASTSSTHQATLTSRLKLNVRCACSTVQWLCLTVLPALSRNPKPYGVRLTNTAFRGCVSSTSSTVPAQTFITAYSRSSIVWVRTRWCFTCRSARKAISRVS